MTPTEKALSKALVAIMETAVSYYNDGYESDYAPCDCDDHCQDECSYCLARAALQLVGIDPPGGILK